MNTTLAAYAGQFARNYSTLPTIDVPILEDRTQHCGTCGDAVVNTQEQPYGLPQYKHVTAADDHYISPRIRCTYCGTDEEGVVVYHQRNWSDEVACSRCGGVHGYAIGD